MEVGDKWFGPDGRLKFSAGLLVTPSDYYPNLYIAYKTFPSNGNKKVKKLARVELCHGRLRVPYGYDSDGVIIHTREIKKHDYFNDKDAALTVGQLVVKKKLPLVDDKEYKIFGESHIEKIATENNIPVLASLPIDPKIAEACDLGKIEYFESDYFEKAAEILKKMEG